MTPQYVLVPCGRCAGKGCRPCHGWGLAIAERGNPEPVRSVVPRKDAA
jgi:hypothetical protein